MTWRSESYNEQIQQGIWFSLEENEGLSEENIQDETSGMIRSCSVEENFPQSNCTAYANVLR